MLLSVGLFTAPATARAGCSHLVGSHSDPFARIHQLDELILSGSSSSPRADGGQSPMGPGSPYRAPCSGPSCSSSRVPLPVSTITPGTDARDRWGNLGVLLVVDNTSAQARTTEEPDLAATGEKSSIFHSPRV
jgi:hypothetical protein